MIVSEKIRLEAQNGAMSGIINTLLYGLAYSRFNILLFARIFPRPFAARKNTTQLAKYPRVLYVKPCNEVYLYGVYVYHKMKTGRFVRKE